MQREGLAMFWAVYGLCLGVALCYGLDLGFYIAPNMVNFQAPVAQVKRMHIPATP